MKAIPAMLFAAAALGAQAQESPFKESEKSYAIPALEIVGFDVLLNLYDRHYFGCCDFDSNVHTIRRNLRSSWVVDRDPFLVNQLGHPYQGSMYHGFARSAGLDYWEGLGYTFLASAMWEIAGETTPPSRNDQINTGIGGSFLGEALFRMASLALDHPGDMPQWSRELMAAAISPPVGFNRLAFGNRFKSFPSRNPVYFTRTQVGFSGTAHNESGNSTTRLRRDEALVDFLIDYGLPGKPEYEYTRPFDYFSFQATASSANGFENAFTRGLLAGKGYSGKSVRGVWGVYGNYDYIAPQTYRVSSTGLSLGTTAQWWINDRLALVGTTMLGVGYTAAGTTGVAGSANPSEDVNFHYGFAPQGLVALRLIYGETAALDLVGREYYVTRVGGPSIGGGYDNIARLEAALTYRIKKSHAVSVRYLFNSRDATLPGGDISQHRATVGLFYTYLGHDLFGAEKR